MLKQIDRTALSNSRSEWLTWPRVPKFSQYRLLTFALMMLLVPFLFCSKKRPNRPPPGPPYGNRNSQEIGDAIYRSGVLGNLINESHAGIFYRYVGGDPRDRNNHDVIHIPNMQGTVCVDKFPAFQSGEEYHGAYTASNKGRLDYTERLAILTSAKLLTRSDIEYVPFPCLDVLVPDWADGQWDGTANDISCIRCDGVVEYVYEASGVMVWGRGDDPDHEDITQVITREEYDSESGNLWEHNDLVPPVAENGDELTPNVQCGIFAPGNTHMHPSVPEDPTRVSQLQTTSHDADGYPKNPCHNYISIKWMDATDSQSGIWGYYVKVDQKPTSIPTWEDYPVIRVEVTNGDSRALPVRAGYVPGWTSPPLTQGRYYVHIRSVDNAGNWGDISGPENCTAHIGPLVIESGENCCYMPYVPGAVWSYVGYPEGVYFSIRCKGPVEIGEYLAYHFHGDDGFGSYNICQPGVGDIAVGGDWSTIPPGDHGTCVFSPPTLQIPASPELGRTYDTDHLSICDDGDPPDSFDSEITPIGYQTVTVPAGQFIGALRMDRWICFAGHPESGLASTYWHVRGIGIVRVEDREDRSVYAELVSYYIPGMTHQQSAVPASQFIDAPHARPKTNLGQQGTWRGRKMLFPRLPLH